MDREIKFRAWDKINKTMIIHEQEFIPVKVTSAGVLRLNPHHEENFWEFMPEDRFELMQYVGITDNKGNEIYEGYIYAHNFANVDNWLVCFENGCFGIKNIGIDGLLSQFFPINTQSFFIDRHLIGNQFQNPQLLKP